MCHSNRTVRVKMELAGLVVCRVLERWFTLKKSKEMSAFEIRAARRTRKVANRRRSERAIYTPSNQTTPPSFWPGQLMVFELAGPILVDME